jgi:hypothetical protein
LAVALAGDLEFGLLVFDWARFIEVLLRQQRRAGSNALHQRRPKSCRQ